MARCKYWSAWDALLGIDTSDEADQVLSFRILSGQFRGEVVEVNNVWTGRAFGDRGVAQRRCTVP